MRGLFFLLGGGAYFLLRGGACFIITIGEHGGRGRCCCRGWSPAVVIAQRTDIVVVPVVVINVVLLLLLLLLLFLSFDQLRILWPHPLDELNGAPDRRAVWRRWRRWSSIGSMGVRLSKHEDILVWLFGWGSWGLRVVAGLWGEDFKLTAELGVVGVERANLVLEKRKVVCFFGFTLNFVLLSPRLKATELLPLSIF